MEHVILKEKHCPTKQSHQCNSRFIAEDHWLSQPWEKSPGSSKNKPHLKKNAKVPSQFEINAMDYLGLVFFFFLNALEIFPLYFNALLIRQKFLNIWHYFMKTGIFKIVNLGLEGCFRMLLHRTHFRLPELTCWFTTIPSCRQSNGLFWQLQAIGTREDMVG